MKIEWDGRTWELDTAGVTLKQAVVITGHMGTTLAEWEAIVFDPNHPRWLPGIGCLYWLMLCQDGQSPVLADVEFPVLRYLSALTDAVTAEAEAAKLDAPAAEPDPTTPAGPPAAAEPPAAALPAG